MLNAVEYKIQPNRTNYSLLIQERQTYSMNWPQQILEWILKDGHFLIVQVGIFFVIETAVGRTQQHL